MSAIRKPSDGELVEQARKGNEQAFRLIVQQHESFVRSTVLGILGETEGADDVAQEVFIRFYRSMDQFRGEARLSTYLCRIAVNLALNEQKRRQRQLRKLTFFRADDPRQPEIEDRSASTELQDTREAIRAALQQLEPDFRTVVVLRLIDGYSVRETAEILQLPEGTVASRLARAQKKLAALLRNIGLHP